MNILQEEMEGVVSRLAALTIGSSSIVTFLLVLFGKDILAYLQRSYDRVRSYLFPDKEYTVTLMDIDHSNGLRNPLFNEAIYIISQASRRYTIINKVDTKWIMSLPIDWSYYPITVEINKKVYEFKYKHRESRRQYKSNRVCALDLRTPNKEDIAVILGYLEHLSTERFRYKDGYVLIYTCKEGVWTPRRLPNNKTWDNIFCTHKDAIIEKIDNFGGDDCKNFDRKNGIPNKLCMAFFGPPGTGKTATVYAIAHYTKMPIFVVSSIEDNLDGIPENSIILVDDFDLFVPKTRETTGFSKMLHFLDGRTLNNNIIVMTSNAELKDFDEALMRIGRLDYKFQFEIDEKVVDDIYRYNKAVGEKGTFENSTEVFYYLRNKTIL